MKKPTSRIDKINLAANLLHSVTRPWQIFGPLSFRVLRREAGNTHHWTLSAVRVFAWPSCLKKSKVAGTGPALRPVIQSSSRIWNDRQIRHNLFQIRDIESAYQPLDICFTRSLFRIAGSTDD